MHVAAGAEEAVTMVWRISLHKVGLLRQLWATCDPSPADAKIDVDFANVADKANAPDVLSTFRSGQLVGGDVSDRESVVNGGDVAEGPADEKKTEEAVLHKQVREA